MDLMEEKKQIKIKSISLGGILWLCMLAFGITLAIVIIR
jgi:hypothetical protein